MKLQRFLFIIMLIALFGSCFYIMNQHYDELARYPYELTKNQRDIVLNRLDAEEINYMVTQKIEPDQFLPFIEIDGFQVNNTLWYTKAMQTKKEDPIYIVKFINKYRDQMEYAQLDKLLKNYSYNILTRFFDENEVYGKDRKLIPDPTDRYTLISDNQSVYTYEPDQLTLILNLPHNSIVDNKNDVMIQKEMLKPLQELMLAAKEINQKKYGDMTIIAGYLSYEDQISMQETMQKKYGDIGFETHWDEPGQNEYQLGYTVSLKPNTDKSASNILSEKEREQANWLKENAYKYGFIIRYPKQKEQVTSKVYQPYTLRYVGKEAARVMYDQEKTMEEMDFKNFK